MIENIRKYTGLMIVVLVLLFVGLVFLGDGVSNSFGSKPVMKTAGQSISQKEFERNLAVRELPASLSFAPLPRQARVLASHYLGDSIIDFQQASPGSIVSQMSYFLQVNSSPERFITNRISVQKAGIDYGVTPSNEEVERFVENVLFADNEGNYDIEAYNDFVKNRITNLGGTKGFNEYVKDLLTAQNLSKLLGGGIAPELETLRAIYDNEGQVITAEQIVIEPGNYEAKVDPSEDEIKAFYEENKANYNSDELRSVSYVHIQPNWKETLEKITAEKAEAAKLAAEKAKEKEAAQMKAEEEAEKANSTEIPQAPQVTSEEMPKEQSEAPETSSPEAGSQGDPGELGEQAPAPEQTEVAQESPPTSETQSPVDSPTPAQPAEDQLNGAEKNQAVNALTQEVSLFIQKVLDDELGANFEALSKEAGYTLVNTDFFSKTAPPKELTKNIQDSPVGSLANAIFLLPANGDSDEKLSNPHKTSSGWFIFRLDEVKESVPLSYEEAKVRVTVDLKKKLARELMVEEAKVVHEKITVALKEGKNFEDAAKALDHSVEKKPQLVAGQSFQGRFFGDPSFEPARSTNAGELAPLELTPSKEDPQRALIIYVDKREIVKDAQYSTQLDNTFNSRSQASRLVAFENWLNDRYKESNVIPPNTSE